MKESLEKAVTTASGATIGAEYILCYNNFDGLHTSGIHSPERFRWLPIQDSYFGNTPELFAAILASGFIGDTIRNYGRTRNNTLIATCGKHFSTATAALAGAYYTLGETLLPQLLPGTADIRDVPAIILTAIAAPIITNKIVTSWNTSWKHKLKNAVVQQNRSMA